MASCSLLLWSIISIINLITIIVFPPSVTAQQQTNVTLRSSIVADADADRTWTSPSGEFAFGFRQVAPGAFLLAIWFDQLPDKTLVWSANRDDPVSAGSRVQLSEDGVLELVDPTSRRVWANPDPARPGTVAYAAMLDTGNFVLASSTSAILWRSFDFPTDTLLPSQILNRDGSLVSAFSLANFSDGRFKLTMQRDGNLELHTIAFPFNQNIYKYWSTATPEAGNSLIFNISGSINLIRPNETLHRPLFNSGALIGDFHRRLTLDHDGVLRHYIYPKSPNPSITAAWSVRDFEPPNICLAVREDNTGGGVCGFNSYCSIGSDGRPSCSCPPGYSARGGHSGCVPDFAQHRCDRESEDSQLFRFTELFNIDWPVVDYANFRNVDEQWCRQSCLADCYCAIAIYHSNRGCFKKPLPFSNGRVDSAFNKKAMIKLRINNTLISNPNTSVSVSASGSSNTTLTITLAALLGCSVLLLLLLCIFFNFYFNHMKSVMLKRSRLRPAGVTAITSFSFAELDEATNGFEEELGRGACSTVYKGELKADGKVVAVKRLNTKLAKEADVEFMAEVSSISRTNHKNLAQLLGYCDEGENRILVYEFMRNGSLATFLFQKHSPRPNWYTRVQIAFAIARGICYLHEDCSVPIIHCDIKPQNVLLDEFFIPKIADFGLAKLMRVDQTRTTTGIRGTRGYVAPEWFRNMAITVKVDVYSFGILLLELLCCRRNYEAEVEGEGEAVLADWAYDCYQEGALDLLVAGDEEAKSDMKMLEVFVKIAIWCIQEDPSMRPHMKRVMHMLEGSIQVPPPPDPTTFIS